MGKIQTVCGKIDSADLGVTTMHEHTVFKPAVLAKILMKSMPDMFKGMKGFENGSDIGMEMERRKQENITGIPTASISSVISSMKMPGTRRELSRRSGINIIIAAGYYTKCAIQKKDLKMCCLLCAKWNNL